MVNRLRHLARATLRSCGTSAMALGLTSAVFVGSSITDNAAQAQLGLRVNPAPITAPLTRSLNVLNSSVSRGVNQLNNQVNRSVGQMNRSVNRSINSMNSYTYGPRRVARYPSYQTQPLATQTMAPNPPYGTTQTLQRRAQKPQKQARLSKEQISAMQEQQAALAKSQAALGILPPAVLLQLSDDQRGLQNAAQSAALDAQIGEIIEWEYEGGYGSVQALSEDNFGTLRCRDFEQVITIDGVNQTATGTACARGNGQWARTTD